MTEHDLPPESGDDLNARLAEKRIGRVLRSKWRIDRLIGVGGMAAVYSGTHRNGSRGAIKVLHAEFASDAIVRERFLHEGYVANRVDHPGVVRVIDDDTDEEGATFLVMELLEGDALDTRALRGDLTIGEALRAIYEVLDVLVAAHDKGIVHRDIKPENLFLTTAGQLKVLDFGIAGVREAGGARGTRTGEAMGTPAFMAPEQALGEWERVDAQSDLWSVGATLFNLLTGRLVHTEATIQRLMLAAMTKHAPSIATVRADLPAPLVELVDRSLRFEKGERYKNAREMQNALMKATASIADPKMRLPSGLGASPTSGGNADAVPVRPGTESTSAYSTDRGMVPRAKSARAVVLAGAGLLVCCASIAAVFVVRARTGAHASSPQESVDAANTPRPEPTSEAAAPSAPSVAASAPASAEPDDAPSAEPTSSAAASASSTPASQRRRNGGVRGLAPSSTKGGNPLDKF